MNEFSKLDPYVRGLALVGGYLQHWAVMENALNSAIGVALGLDSLATLVVSKNIQLRDKIKILRTSLDGAFIYPVERRDKLKSIVQKASHMSNDRNMIAHDMFVSTEGGDGVTFFVTKAAGKLEIKDNIWPQSKFEEQYKLLDNLTDELTMVKGALIEAASLKALNSEMRSQPNRLLGALGPLGTPSRPLPELRSSDPSGEQTDGETTQASDLSPQPEK